MTAGVLKLAIPLYVRIYIFGGLGVATVAPVLLLPVVLQEPNADPSVALLLLPWLLILGVYWWWILRIPHTIRVHDDGSLEFVAVLRTVTLQARRLASIAPVGFGNNLYRLKHDDGKLWLFLQFTGFYRLLGELKADNPNFDIKGC